MHPENTNMYLDLKTANIHPGCDLVDRSPWTSSLLTAAFAKLKSVEPRKNN